MQSGAKSIGVLLAICGNTLIACSLTLQKHAYNAVGGGFGVTRGYQPTGSGADGDEDEDGARRRAAGEFAFLSNPTWWTGTALMAAGEVGNFSAFAFAPSSVVAPLGAWSVVLAAVLAHAFLGEPTTRRNVSGIALCVSGAFLIGTAGPDLSATEEELDMEAVTTLIARTPFVVFMALTLAGIALLVAVGRFTSLGDEYIVVHIGVSSLLGGVTVVAAKALATFLRLMLQGNSQLGNWLPLVLVVVLAVAIVTQLRYLNLAMARFGNSQVVPVYYVLFTICAMTSGAIMFKEFDQLKPTNLPFFIGIAATMSGVFLVARETENVDPEKDGADQATFASKADGFQVDFLGMGEVEHAQDQQDAVEGTPVQVLPQENGGLANIREHERRKARDLAAWVLV